MFHYKSRNRHKILDHARVTNIVVNEAFPWKYKEFTFPYRPWLETVHNKYTRLCPWLKLGHRFDCERFRQDIGSAAIRQKLYRTISSPMAFVPW